jgi:hypothetical protein
MYIAEVEPIEVASFAGQGNLEKEERRFLVLNVKDSHAAEELNGDAYGRHQPEIGAILINSMLGQGDLATSYNYLSSKHDIPWMAQDAKLDEVGPSGTAYRGDVVIPHEAMHAWMFIKYGYGLGGSRDIYSAGDIIEAHELELLGIDSRAEITPEIIDELAGHAFGILEGAEESELLGRYGFNLCTRNPLASPSSYKLETNVCTRLALSDGDFEWESMMNGRPFGSVEGLSRSTAEPINATLVSAMRNIGPLELSRDDYKIIGRAYTGMAINASVRAYERVRSGRH